MATSDRSGTARAVRWLAAGTAIVALLAGVVHQLTMSTLLEGGFSYMGADVSGIGAVLGLRSVQGFLLVGAGLFACWPALVFVLRADGDGDGVRRAWLLAVAALPPALAAVILVGASGDRWPLVVPVLLVMAAGVLLSLSVSLTAAVTRFGWPPGGGGRLLALPLGFAALVLVAFLVGTTAAAPLSGLAETRDVGVPAATFAFETTETANGTRLTVTHDGGDRVPADWVHIEGDLAAVPGVDRTRSGTWNGTTSPAADGRVVEPGDTVAVGLADPDDCVVRVVYRDGAVAATLDRYECGSS